MPPLTRRAPRPIRELALVHLADEKRWKRERFEIRLDRWWPDVEGGLRRAYGPEAAPALAERLAAAAAAAYAERSAELSHLDDERTLRADWYQCEAMLGYAAYVDRFAGDLAGVGRHIGYLSELGVTYLHLAGACALVDARHGWPQSGPQDDLAPLASLLRQAGISLGLDVVLDGKWASSDGLAESAELVFRTANLGVEVVGLDVDGRDQSKLDALRVLRALARIVAPAVVLRIEAAGAPGDPPPGPGRGDRYGDVGDLAGHDRLMVQTWSMLAAGDVRLAGAALRSLTSEPPTTARVTYVRNHDAIGWAVADEDAAAIGIDGSAHRRFLSAWYSGDFPGSPATGLLSPEGATSGTTASLAGLERAGTDAGAVELVVGRILLAHALAFGWGGVPVIWMGDELATVNDAAWAEEPGHGGDIRWAHRPAMAWERAPRRRDPGTVEGRVFAGLRHLAAVRATLPQLHASVETELLEITDPGVLALVRPHPVGPLAELYNVTAEHRVHPPLAQGGAMVDALTGRRVEAGAAVELDPYEVLWLTEPG
jgi:hypothetical protein